MSNSSNLVNRYSASERGNHWFVAITFILTALSGLALFHPAFFFLSNLFGGGPWTRILHPFLGLAMLIAFLVLAVRFRADNHITDADREWGRHLNDVVCNRTENLPEVGKYNLGQKYLYWTLIFTILLLFASGVVIWQPYFAPLFGITILRLAVVIHAFAAFVAIAAIIVHIYAAIWVKGSIRAMTRGTVTAAWARHHHGAWYKKITKGAR